MERRDKTNYYLDIAEVVAERGTCLRRNFGAIIVKTMKLSLQDIQEHQEAEVTVAI